MVPWLRLGPLALHRLVAPALALAVALAGCGDSTDRCTRSSECEGAQRCVEGRCMPPRDSGTPDSSIRDGGMQVDAADECASDCGDGACIDGNCCPVERTCGETCCGAGQVCSFAQCVEPGAACTATPDCADDEYCELRLDDTSETCQGREVQTGRCLPRPPQCDSNEQPDPADLTCVAECTFDPVPEPFDLELKYSWGNFDVQDPTEPNPFDVRNAPLVVQMDDDDCDDRITERDVPEIVVATSPEDSVRDAEGNPIGDLVVLSVRNGELVERGRAADSVNPWTVLAAGDIDGNKENGNEIVSCSVDRSRVVAYRDPAPFDDRLDLQQVWRSPEIGGTCAVPSIADLDQDGTPEVITKHAVLDGTDGTIAWDYDADPQGFVIASDIDDDGAHDLELVSAGRAYDLRGGQWKVVADSGKRGTSAAVAQLDGTGPPEVIGVSKGRREVFVWHYDADASDQAEMVRSGVDIHEPVNTQDCPSGETGATRGGGPPTVANVNVGQDSVPDVAVAGGELRDPLILGGSNSGH